ncbi:MAG: pilus assembly protein [Hyphomonadaceae bacterium]|nr:pilus assembly protein [Hyphomonadaceae bacterium]
MTLFAFGRRSLTREQGGTAAVEFAMIAPVLFACIVGLLMLGMAYYEGATVQWSLERTLRAAMLDPDITASEIEAALNERLEPIGSPDIDFSYVIDDSGSVPVAVATANYDVPLHVPFVPDLALHFSAESVAPAPAG